MLGTVCKLKIQIALAIKKRSSGPHKKGDRVGKDQSTAYEPGARLMVSWQLKGPEGLQIRQGDSYPAMAWRRVLRKHMF